MTGFVIFGIYHKSVYGNSSIFTKYEAFHPTSTTFESYNEALDWIRIHREFFHPCKVLFAIFPLSSVVSLNTNDVEEVFSLNLNGKISDNPFK